MIQKNITTAFFIVMALTLTGCASAEKSASMVIDNAASVIRTGQEKAWIDPDATPTPIPAQE